MDPPRLTPSQGPKTGGAVVAWKKKTKNNQEDKARGHGLGKKCNKHEIT